MPKWPSLRVTTATAIDECLITRIAKIATMHDEPKFSELFMAALLSRNSRIEEDLIDQLFNSSEKRLAHALLLLANFGKEDAPKLIGGKFSQEILAEMIGTTRSRVSHFMNKFRKSGYIKYNGKLEIHHSLLNVVLYDKPQTDDSKTSRSMFPLGVIVCFHLFSLADAPKIQNIRRQVAGASASSQRKATESSGG